MATTEKRAREKEVRRLSIVNAAERVFFSKGVEVATMDEVAEAAAISKGLLYVYFKNKEDLYNAVCFRGLRLLRQAFERAVRSQKTGLRQAHGVGQAYVRFARDYPNHFSSIVYQAARDVGDDPEGYAGACERERDRIIRLVAAAIRAGIDDGSIRDDLEPLATAVMLWGQMHGVIQVAVLKRIQTSYDVAFEELITFAFGFVTDALRPR